MSRFIYDTQSANFFRNNIKNILVTASWVEGVKHLTGLKAVSQVWGEKPAWYFWIKNMSGAYSLQLENSETVKEDIRHWRKGNFSMITGIVGEVGEVLSAFIGEGLDDPRFYMPGYKPTS